MCKISEQIKVVDIHELNNFGIHHFLCWNQFGSQILVRTCRFSRFQIWNVQILSNDKMTKIKVVDIHELNNFGIHHFLCWNQFGSQILVRTCRFSKFKNWKVQILSNDEMTKIKVVDLDELNNFCIHHFYIWNHLGF
jgi:ferredoxin-fold anticodon binding domain-containing protein